MKIQYVEIQNILSIEHLRVDFGDAGLVLIDGWNHDDDTANGSGKTAILNSIAYGLYGLFPRNITVSGLLRHGTKSGFVKVGVDINGVLYEVIRGRPSHLSFFIDGVEKPDYSQEQFLSKLNVDYALYMLIMYSSQFQYTNLIQCNDADKKNFFLQLLNLSKFSNKKKSLDIEIKRARETLYEMQLEEKGVTSRIDTLKEMIVNEDDIKQKIAQQDLPSKIKSFNDKKSTISQPDISKIEALEETLAARYEELLTTEADNKQKVRRVLELKKLITTSQNIEHDRLLCPHCNNDIVLTADGATTREAIKEKHDSYRATLTDELQLLSQELTLVEDILEEKSKIKDTIRKCRDKKRILSEVYQVELESLSGLKVNIMSIKQLIGHYNDQLENNHSNLKKISDLEHELVKLIDNIGNLSQKISMWEAISHMLSPTGAPAYLLDSIIEIFNAKMGVYVEMLWPNATYTLKTFKENKSGDIRAKFSEFLSVNGTNRSIGSLSGGELRCLAICADIAALDTLETILGVRLNPLMWDEPLNDLDASNRERVMDMLSTVSKNRQIVMVDHSSETKSMFSKVIQVEKRNGISRLV